MSRSVVAQNAEASPPKVVDLWAMAEEEEHKNIDNFITENTVIIVGEKGTGKTSLVNLMKNTAKDEIPKPTSAMDYCFLRKAAGSKKEICHIYELGGGKLLENLLTVPITAENYRGLSFMIVLDLSEPGNAMESLIYWIKSIKEKCRTLLNELFASNPAAIEELRALRLQTLDSTEERAKVDVSLLPIHVIAHKYDKIEDMDPELRKWLARILRYYCHINGASLFYSSVINPKLAPQIRAILNGIYFAGPLNSQYQPQLYLQRDHLKSILVTFGADALDTMGFPAGNPVEIIRKVAKDYFPTSQTENKSVTNVDVTKFPEPKIDSSRVEKDKELKRIIKENAEIQASIQRNPERSDTMSSKGAIGTGGGGEYAGGYQRDTMASPNMNDYQETGNNRPPSGGYKRVRPSGAQPVKLTRELSKNQ